VRDAVLSEWRSAKQTEVSRDYLIALRNKFGVELDDTTKAVLGPEPAPKVATQ
ncbi:MAG: peptidyl-prolyl cis-trans isomerase, partial [Mesorhizobium sp.]